MVALRINRFSKREGKHLTKSKLFLHKLRFRLSDISRQWSLVSDCMIFMLLVSRRSKKDKTGYTYRIPWRYSGMKTIQWDGPKQSTQKKSNVLRTCMTIQSQEIESSFPSQ